MGEHDTPHHTDKPYTTILYHTSECNAVAYITLNRPAQYNAIVYPMPFELADAVHRANADNRVHVIVLSGAGRGFSAGYDLQEYAGTGRRGEIDGSQDTAHGYDPLLDYQGMHAFTECYMSLYQSHKPTICKLHGTASSGGSDIALSCDLIVMADDARIGYPPARLWGSPTTAWWTYRVGMQQAKRLLFTGDLISGKEAERIGLVLKSVPKGELDAAVHQLVDRIKTVPCNQLWMNKSVINSVYDTSIQNTQRFSTIMDGLTRHTPEGVAFQQSVARNGLQQAIAARDRSDRTLSNTSRL